MKQQTAVEWLEYKLLTEGLDDEFIKQAKRKKCSPKIKSSTCQGGGHILKCEK